MGINYKQLAINVGYSYLNGGYGKWEDGKGTINSYDAMDNKYLENCIQFVDRGINEIRNNKDGIVSYIGAELGKMIKNPSEKDIEYAKEQIIEILKEKKEELEDCMNERKHF